MRTLEKYNNREDFGFLPTTYFSKKEPSWQEFFTRSFNFKGFSGFKGRLCVTPAKEIHYIAMDHGLFVRGKTCLKSDCE